MKPSTRATVLAAVALVSLCGTPWAADFDLNAFYSISFSAQTTNLYKFNPPGTPGGSIAYELVAPLELDGHTPNFMTNSIAFSPDNKLYGWDTGHKRLYRIDFFNQYDAPYPFAGEINYIGVENANANLDTQWINGISFLRDGTLYGISGNTDKLYRIDTGNGCAVEVGSIGMDILHTGMAVDFTTNQLYAVSGLADNQPDYLLKINPGEAVIAQFVGNLGTNLNDVAVEFDGNGNLYTIRDRNRLYKINVATGFATHWGDLGTGYGPLGTFQSTNLAHPWPTDTAPVPEPGTLLLLGSGLAGLAGYGRKKLKK